MLQKLRKYSKSWISGLFMGILSLAFVSWGVGDLLQGHTDTSVVKVGDTAVSQDDFKRDYNNTLKNLSAQQGRTVTPQEAHSQHVGDNLLQQSILDTALNNVAHQLKLTATDEAVTTRIRSMQQFAGLNGVFDRRTFESLISQFGYTEAGFINSVRQDYSQAQLTQAVSADFGMPEGYARALMAYIGEMRAVNYVTVDGSLITSVPAPTDKALQAYVKAHAATYSTPEYRDVTYARLGADNVADQVKVTDEMLKRAYENHKSDYVVPEKREVSRLTFPKQADAEAAYKKIQAGTSFEDIAKERGFKPADIALGEIQAADLDKTESKEVFAAKEGGVTAPTKSTFGFNIYKVTKVIPGKTTPMAEVKDALTADILKQLVRAKLDDYANTYTDAISNGFTFNEAAKKAGMKIEHIAEMDASGLAPDGSKTAAPDDPEFREQVFKAEIGEDGDPLMTKDGVLYIVKVNGMVPPKLKALKDVRDQALAAWTVQKKAELLKAKVGQLVAQANKAGSLDAIAKTVGSKIEKSGALTRQRGSGPIAGDLLETIYTAKPGSAVAGRTVDGKSYVIARVIGVAHPLPPEKSTQYKQIMQALSRGIGQDLTLSFAYDARDKQGVKINQKIFNAAIGLGEGS